MVPSVSASTKSSPRVGPESVVISHDRVPMTSEIRTSQAQFGRLGFEKCPSFLKRLRRTGGCRNLIGVLGVTK